MRALKSSEAHNQRNRAVGVFLSSFSRSSLEKGWPCRFSNAATTGATTAIERKLAELAPIYWLQFDDWRRIAEEFAALP